MKHSTLTSEIEANSMWRASDIREGRRYQFGLVVTDGYRRFKLLDLSDSLEPEECLFLTEEVPPDLLVRRDYEAIAERVRLVSGEWFHVDAHGTWLTHQEYEALEAGVPFEDVPWLSGKPPKFAPK